MRDEASGQDVLEEATQKLHRIECQHAVTVATGIVLVAEAHRVRVCSRDPAVGDGDAMGVAGEVLEHLLGAAEGWLGIDHPLLATQLLAERCKASRICQIRQGAVELETIGSEVFLQRREHLATKQAREDPDREEKAVAAG